MKTTGIIPYVRIGQMIEMIKVMPTGDVSINELILNVSLRRTQIKNIIPSLESLGLLEYHSGKIRLTKKGQEFRLNIKSNNEKGSQNIIKDLIGRVEPLSYIVELLNQQQKLTTDQIGRELAIKYKKVWNHPLTYKTHGAACASIIAFAGHGVYDRGVLRKGALVSVPLKIPFPNVTFKKIIKILEIIYPRGECSLKELSKLIGTSEGRLATEMVVCAELKLVDRESRGLYKISEIGDKLISPLAKEERSSIFKDCLLKSRYNLIIEKLADSTFNIAKLGEIIVYLFRVKSTSTTQLVYATKFLNWLNYAQIVKKVKKGFYALDKSKLKEKNWAKAPTENGKLIKSIKPDRQLLKYYEIGKLVGIVVSSCEKKEAIKENVEKLATIWRELDGTEDILTLLNEHIKLFEGLKDPRIFLADIGLLEKRIRSKEI